MTKRKVADSGPEWKVFLEKFTTNDLALALRVCLVTLPWLESRGLIRTFSTKIPLDLFVSNQISVSDLQHGLQVLVAIKQHFYFRAPTGKGIEKHHEPKIRFVENEDFTSGHVEGLETLPMKEVCLRLQQSVPEKSTVREVKQVGVHIDHGVPRRLLLSSREGIGFVRINQKKAGIEIGKTNSRKYRVLVALADIEIAHPIHDVFEDIRIKRDDLNSLLKDPRTRVEEEFTIIENAVKELQKIPGIKGKIFLRRSENMVYLDIPS